MKTSTESKHGGTRANAGRKSRDPQGTCVVSVRMTGEEKSAFDMLGGVQWLRHYLGELTEGRRPDRL